MNALRSRCLCPLNPQGPGSCIYANFSSCFPSYVYVLYYAMNDFRKDIFVDFFRRYSFLALTWSVEPYYGKAMTENHNIAVIVGSSTELSKIKP